MISMLWIALFMIGAGFVIACPMTALMRAVGVRAGTLDTPGSAGHEKQLRPVPNTGGVAIYLAVAAPMAIGLGVVSLADPDWLGKWVPTIQVYMPRIAGSTPIAVALLLCLTGLHLVGVVDDRRGLGPLPKIIVQILAAAVMVIFFNVRLLTLLDNLTPLGPGLSIAATIGWIVIVTNAINFIDNMDGLAAGVCTIAAGLFMAATIINSQWFIAITLGLLIGALLGFLIFNFPPARIFMGDGGSLVVGFLLAILTVRTTFWQSMAGDDPLGGGWYALFMPLIVLAIPLYDLCSVTSIRLRQGRSPFVGDQQHFSHRLVERGMTKKGAVIVIWSATAVTGIGGISLGQLEDWQAILVGVQTILVLLMLVLLEHASRHAARERL